MISLRANNRLRYGLRVFWKRFVRHDISGLAAKSAYYLLLSIFPLTLLLHSVTKTDARTLSILFAPRFVTDILSNAAGHPNVQVTLLSIALLIWPASTAIWALLNGIHVTYTGRCCEKIRSGRYRAVVLTAGLAAVVFLCLSLPFLVGNMMRITIEISGLFLCAAGLYRAVPNARQGAKKMPPSALIPGAIAAAFFWALTARAFEFYMRKLGGPGAAYGDARLFLGLAVWLYAFSMILFCGAELNRICFLLRAKKTFPKSLYGKRQ